MNSDDPAYFGGYLVDNLAAIQQALDLGREQMRHVGPQLLRGCIHR